MLAVAGEGHDHIAVAVVGGADGGCVAVLQVDREVLFGFEHFEEVVDESRVERDRNRLAAVRDRELDSRLADFGGLAGQHERAVAEREIDAAAFFARDDRRLSDG